MINPFQYGGIVEKEAFCNRKQELTDLVKAMRNGERLFVYSERRMGKTSLIKQALNRLPKKGYLYAYIDLWPTDNEESFSAVTAKAITESTSTNADRMLQTARNIFSRMTPSISTNSDGNPQINFDFGKSTPIKTNLDEVLSAPKKIASKRKSKIIIVFDEFQRILEYSSDLVERSLRSVVQNQQGIAYIFLGSRKHLIQKMFLDKSKPLYRAGGHYPLRAIDRKDWEPFIRERFNKYDRKISDPMIQSICNITDGHPFYTQHLCHAIWELCETGKHVTEEIIQSALYLLLDRENYAYTALWESLAINHRRFLIGLSKGHKNIRIFSSDFVQQYNLKSASNVQRVIETLMDKDIIDRENGSFIITDRFFRNWINKSGF